MNQSILTWHYCANSEIIQTPNGKKIELRRYIVPIYVFDG